MTRSKYMCLIGMIALVLSSCSVSRHLPQDTYLLDKVKVVSEEEPKVVSSLKGKMRQRPNVRTFGLIRLPMRIYSLSGLKDNWVNRTLRNIGEPPRVYSDTLARKSCEAMELTLVNQGYLKAKVQSETTYDKNKAKVKYYAHPGAVLHTISRCSIFKDRFVTAFSRRPLNNTTLFPFCQHLFATFLRFF